MNEGFKIICTAFGERIIRDRGFAVLTATYCAIFIPATLIVLSLINKPKYSESLNPTNSESLTGYSGKSVTNNIIIREVIINP